MKEKEVEVVFTPEDDKLKDEKENFFTKSKEVLKKSVKVTGNVIKNATKASKKSISYYINAKSYLIKSNPHKKDIERIVQGVMDDTSSSILFKAPANIAHFDPDIIVGTIIYDDESKNAYRVVKLDLADSKTYLAPLGKKLVEVNCISVGIEKV